MRLDAYNHILLTYNEIITAISKDVYDFAKRQKQIDTTGRGGRGRSVEIIYDTLPERYKSKVCEVLGNPREVLDLVPVTRKSARIPFHELSVQQVQLCNAKFNLVNCYREFAELHKDKGITTAKKEFVNLVRQGVLCADSYEVVGSISFQTLERWNKELHEGGNIPDAFAPFQPLRKQSQGTKEHERTL